MWGLGIGGDKGKKEVSPAQQIPLLISRAKNCSTLQDKREAVQELQGMNGADLMEMGNGGFESLMTVLRLNSDDSTISNGVLMVMTELIEGSGKETFLQVFADKENNFKGVETLLAVLHEQGFHAKYNVLRFLTSLVEYHPSVVSKFSTASNGLHTLVNILNDNENNGILRNEGLLLMKSIAITDEEVQKIIVYENIFDSLFKIIKDEGGVNGGILVEDCLDILHHLLATNISNQKYFRDFTGLSSLIPLLTFDESQLTDSASKIVVLTIYLISYFLKGKRAEGEVTKTVNAIAGITTRKGEEVLTGNSLLNGLASVSIHPSPNVEAQTEALRCLTMLAEGSDTIKEQLLSLVVERKSGLYKWINHLTGYLTADDNTQRQCVAAELFATMLKSSAIHEQVSAGVVGEVNNAAQPHPGKMLVAGLFSTSPVSVHYCSYILSQLLTCPSVQTNMLSSTFDGTSTFASLITSLTLAVREQKAIHSHALFRVILKWLSNNPPAVLQFLENMSAATFFIETANADGIEPIAIQVLSCALVGVGKIALDGEESEEYVIGKRTLRDALVRRIGLDRFLVRFNALRQDDSFVRGASITGVSPSPGLWDADLEKLIEGIYEEIQKSVLLDIAAPAAEGSVASGDNESLRQVMQQRDADMEILRKELMKVKEELAAARETPPVEETIVSIKQNFHQKEVEMDTRLAEQVEHIRKLEMELEEEKRRRMEDQKMAEIQKKITEENVNSMAESKAMMEKENLNLLTTLTSVEERLDQTDSRLALLGQAALDNSALKAALDSCGASRYLDSTYPSNDMSLAISAPPPSKAADPDQIVTYKKKVQQLEMDQNDLYALLGEYDERLRQLTERRPMRLSQ
eukprot:TRINITY_DN6980_c0_g1_i1.p1 TRINITY_DN6980_c0_g1~~TRINITY_DN6980_c0_g1_i1.p1  ORF type:complete len:863 (+),score=269.58 TRINITY_DN6980_c0_g1_i1:44-2632(+)